MQEERNDDDTIGDLLSSKFVIEINKERYNVYPHIETMIGK